MYVLPFQKYLSFQVPYPKDTENILAKIDELNQQAVGEIKEHLLIVEKSINHLTEQVSEKVFQETESFV
jgi:hypothetical protein